MATVNDTINLALGLTDKGNSVSAKEKDFDNLDKAVNRNIKSIQALSKQLDKLGKNSPVVQGIIKDNASTSSARSALAAGTPRSAANNAYTQGVVNTARGSELAAQARIINNNETINTQIKRSIANYEIQQLSLVRQRKLSDDLVQLKKQEAAQGSRLVKLQAEVILKQEQGKVVTKKILADLATEDKLYQAIGQKINNIQVANKQRLKDEKEIAKLAAAQAAKPDVRSDAAIRARKEQILLGDGGASLFKVQAGLLVNYSVMSQIFSLFQFGTQYVIQFDKALRDLQAVTDTSNLSMKSLSETFVAVSQNSKFSAVELAQAAITLGQAGLSASQINDSIKSVADLATATGSDLATSVDVVTSALTVFNLNASETEHVANVMTGALNLSKLTMDKLQLGIQYAGNTAAEAGITLEELTASLGAMSNAGIKSGSTLGTGLSQVLVELQNPSKKLSEQLKLVGLTIQDVDVKANGLTNVIDTMTRAGFGASQAFQGMDLRGARAFLALSRNIDVARDMETALQLTTAATKAQEIQMRSLANSGAKLANSFGAVLLQIGEPFKQALITVANSLSSVLSFLNQFPVLLQVVGTALLATFSTAVIGRLGLLVSGLFATGPALAVLSTGMATVTSSTTVATVATTRMTGALSLLGKTPILRFLSLVTIAAIGLNSAFNNSSSTLDTLNSELEEAKGKFDSTQESISSVDIEVKRLNDRYISLSSNSSALRNEVIAMQTKFGDFTSDLRVDTIKTVDDLIVILRKLQGEMRQTAIEQLRLTQGKAAQSFSESSSKDASKFTSSLIGDAFYTGDINKTRGKRNKYGTLASKYSGIDISSKSIEELSTIQNEYLNVRGDLQKEANRLQAEITSYTTLINKKDSKLTDTQSKQYKLLIDKNKRSLSSVEEPLNSVTEKASLLSNQISFKRLENNSLVENSTQVVDFNKKIDEVAKELSVAKTTGKGNLIKAAKKKSEELSKEIKDSAEIISTQTGVSKSDVQNILDTTLLSTVNEQVNQVGESYKGLGEGVSKSHNKYLTEISKKQDISLGEIELELEKATNAADTRIAQLDATIAQITDKERGGLRGLYSDAEVRLLGDEKRGVENQKISQELEARKASQPIYEQLLIQAEKEKVSVLKSKSSYEDKKKAVDNYNEAAKKQLDNLNRINELTTEESARNGTLTESHRSLSDQISSSIALYVEQLKIQEDLGLNIDKNLNETFDNARNSFKGFVKDFVTGNQTAGQSFRAFASSVIENLLDIASNQVSNQIFSGILGVGKRAISGPLQGPGTDGASIGGSFLSDIFGFNSGGYIRAAGGTAINTRDSKHILARPGEYVLRNSAVDMIGKDNLDNINAMGNRKISDSASGITPLQAAAQPAPVNVYVVSPDAKPTLTKNDVLVTIEENISRGGNISKLIKQIGR